MIGWLVAAAAGGWLVAALLAVGETGLDRSSRAALAEAARTGPGAARIRMLGGDPTTAASAAAAVRIVFEALAAVALAVSLAQWLVWWQALIVGAPLAGAIALVVVRYVARRLGREHPVSAVRATSGLLVAALAVGGRLRLAQESAQHRDWTDEEIRDVVDLVSESESIEDEEAEMFRSVLELGETTTRAVMVPRTEMITIPSQTSIRKALSLFLRSGYSRVPLVGDSVDDVLGVVYLKDLVRHRFLVEDSDDSPVDALARPAAFVPESKPVDELLREMQHGPGHLALVVDEFGGIAGLVTIEDALEEIVGELTDEHDRSGPEVEDLGDGRFRIPSRMSLDDLGELFDLDIDDEDVETAGGLLAKALGKVPLVGSRAEVSGLVLEAERVEGRRKLVSTLVVSRASTEEDEQ